MARILIVDDEEGIRMSFRSILRENGYQAEVAEDAATALDQLNTLPFEVVIADIVLPGMDGVKLLETIRERAPSTQVVMISGVPTVESLADAVRLGAFDYLQKPVTSEALIRSVSNAVRSKFLIDEKIRLETENLNHQRNLESLIAERTAELHESERKFRSVVESANDAIVAIDSHGDVVFANRMIEQILGYRPAELIGQPLMALMPERFREKHKQGVERVASGGGTRIIGQTLEMFGLHKDGTEVPIELSLSTWTSDSKIFFTGNIRDITERKRTDRALRDYADRQASVSKLGLDALKETHVDDLMREICKQTSESLDVEMCRILELLPDGAGLAVRAEVGWNNDQDDLQIISSDADTQPGYALAVNDTVIVADLDTETRFARVEDLRRHDVSSGASVIIRGHDQPYGVFCIHTAERRSFTTEDISYLQSTVNLLSAVVHRDSVEQSLRDSQERFDLAIQGSNDGYWDWPEMEQDVGWWSPRLYELLGYSADEIPASNKTLREMIHPEDRRRLSDAYDGHLNHRQPFAIDFRLKTKSGNFRWFLGRGQAVWDSAGKPIRMSGSVHDIHDERLAGDWLRIQTAALDAAANGIVITDPQGMIIWSNRSVSELTGYTAQELHGRSTNILKSDLQTAGFYEELWRTISDGNVWHGELVNRRKNGSTYPEEMTITPVKGSEGDIVHYVAIKQNITERRKAQQALIDERNNLEETVQVRTRELNRSLQELQDANLSLSEAGLHKNRFLSSMSHELRTPLNAILGFSDLLKGEYYGKLNEKQSSYVQQIDESGKHLLDLINDLLDIAKIDAGAMSIDASQFSPADLIDGSVSIMGTLSRKKNITIEVDIDPTIRLFSGDLRKCKQIMFNLLSNAIKYTPEQGRIEVNASPVQQNGVKISVTDTGIGVPEDLQDNIFSEFYQADRVRDEALGGTGIGLALTKRLVELHEGEIGVNSVSGKGSTFWFILPHANRDDLTTPNTPKSRDLSQAGFPRSRRILVVEDNSANLKMIRDMLDMQDHEVAEAGNGQEAIELAGTFEPDLIIMDIRMPVMDGLEATRQLRRLPAFYSTPIVALTASADRDSEGECLGAGCTSFMTKPFLSETLFQMLERLLMPQSIQDE